jgi:hypothetical protein
MIYKVCILSRFVFLGAFFWAISNYCAEKFIYSPLYFIEGLPAVIMAGLSAVFLIRCLYGGVAEWRACPPLFLSAIFVADWRAGLNSLVKR